MAFIDNHDTDRFLGNGHDTLMLKQALALLLTVRRIPQIYYGTEIMMNGTKEVTDGNVRKDFPGGFPGDTINCFLPPHDQSSNSQIVESSNNMFQWLSRLLHWRQNNPIIISGKQTQFIPYNGVYVIARQLQPSATEEATNAGKSRLQGNEAPSGALRGVLTILNGTTKPAKMEVKRYAEVIGQTQRAKDVLTGRYYDLSHDLELKPRQSLILQF